MKYNTQCCMFTLLKYKYVWILIKMSSHFYLKLHVFRERVSAVNLIGGLSCDVSRVCGRDWPVLWRGWVYRGEQNWRG